MNIDLKSSIARFGACRGALVMVLTFAAAPAMAQSGSAAAPQTKTAQLMSVGVSDEEVGLLNGMVGKLLKEQEQNNQK